MPAHQLRPGVVGGPDAVQERRPDDAVDGYAAAGITGLRDGSSHDPLPLPADARDYPVAVSQAVTRLRLAGVDGPYRLLLGADAFTEAAETSDHGYPVKTHLSRATDVAPAWREQLVEGGRLVVPLDVGGYTRSITLVRRGDVLHAEHWTFCGFVRDRGAAARTAPTATLARGEVTVRWELGTAGDASGLEEALRSERYELSTGLVVAGQFNFETLQLLAATTLPGFCRLSVPSGSGLVAQADAAAIVADGSLAYLTHIKISDGPEPADRRSEFYIHAYGATGPELAERFARCVRTWDREIREGGYPALSIHPAGTPGDQLPPGDLLDTPACRMVFGWPGRATRVPAPAPAHELVSTRGQEET